MFLNNKTNSKIFSFTCLEKFGGNKNTETVTSQTSPWIILIYGSKKEKTDTSIGNIESMETV